MIEVQLCSPHGVFPVGVCLLESLQPGPGMLEHVRLFAAGKLQQSGKYRRTDNFRGFIFRCITATFRGLYFRGRRGP